MLPCLNCLNVPREQECHVTKRHTNSCYLTNASYFEAFLVTLSLPARHQQAQIVVKYDSFRRLPTIPI